MKVNLGTLSITIGLILVAVSILVVGLMAERRISGLTVRLTTLEKGIPFIRAGIKRTIIAQGYAFRKADSQKRAITVEDLKEGYALADKFAGK